MSAHGQMGNTSTMTKATTTRGMTTKIATTTRMTTEIMAIIQLVQFLFAEVHFTGHLPHLLQAAIKETRRNRDPRSPLESLVDPLHPPPHMSTLR